MEITVNGEKQTIGNQMTVAQYLEGLGIDPETVVIERNLDILSRDNHSEVMIEEGDSIEIDIPKRTINVDLDDKTLAARRAAMAAKGAQAWKPVNRQREVSAALRAYAAMTTSAARGAVRDVSQLEKK